MGSREWGRGLAWCAGGRAGSASLGPDSASVRPGPSSLRPGSSSLRPGPSSLRPGPSSVRPDSSSVRPDSSSVRPDSSSVRPDSASLRPDSSSLRPDSASLRPDSSNAPPRPAAHHCTGSSTHHRTGCGALFLVGHASTGTQTENRYQQHGGQNCRKPVVNVHDEYSRRKEPRETAAYNTHIHG